MLSDRPRLSLVREFYTIDTFSKIPVGMELLNVIVCVLHSFQIHMEKAVILMES